MFKKFSKIAGTIATATLEGIIIAEATRQEMIAEEERRHDAEMTRLGARRPTTYKSRPESVDFFEFPTTFGQSKKWVDHSDPIGWLDSAACAINARLVKAENNVGTRIAARKLAQYLENFASERVLSYQRPSANVLGSRIPRTLAGIGVTKKGDMVALTAVHYGGFYTNRVVSITLSGGISISNDHHSYTENDLDMIVLF